jgi:hypothetical protein
MFTPLPVLNCSHIQYFQQTPVHGFFDSLGPVPAPAIPPPPPTPTSIVELQNDLKVPPPIKLQDPGPDYITKGGLKIPVKKKQSR